MLFNRHDLPMIWVGQYKCPYCKHRIVITRGDFIKGIAVVSCTYCGNEAFTIEENGFSRQPLRVA
jgi:transcription elongation factor Elf1